MGFSTKSLPQLSLGVLDVIVLPGSTVFAHHEPWRADQAGFEVAE
jgi:hypothetical protein